MNIEDFVIVDDFLNQSEFYDVSSYISSSDVPWIHQSSGEKKGLWFLFHDCTEKKFYNTVIFEKIKKITEKDYVIQDIYFNGQWPGRDGDFHIDECDFTILLYVSDYDPEWGGFTHFINSNNPKDHLAIPPITNRLVIFPSHIKHKAYSFCSQDCPMRISLTFKLDKK